MVLTTSGSYKKKRHPKFRVATISLLTKDQKQRRKAYAFFLAVFLVAGFFADAFLDFFGCDATKFFSTISLSVKLLYAGICFFFVFLLQINRKS